MTWERIGELHLGEILGWWEGRDEGSMPVWLLPPFGVVAVDDEGGLCAAGWLTVFEGVSAGQIDWLVARPGLRMQAAREACRLVYEGLETEARRRGLRMIFASALRASMAREARACGFTETAGGVVHLAKAVS